MIYRDYFLLSNDNAPCYKYCLFHSPDIRVWAGIGNNLISKACRLEISKSYKHTSSETRFGSPFHRLPALLILIPLRQLVSRERLTTERGMCVYIIFIYIPLLYRVYISYIYTIIIISYIYHYNIISLHCIIHAGCPKTILLR